MLARKLKGDASPAIRSRLPINNIPTLFPLAPRHQMNHRHGASADGLQPFSVIFDGEEKDMGFAEKIRSGIRDVEGYPKPGIIFKDITPLLADPGLVKEVVSHMAAKYRGRRIDAVAAIEARGFILGSILAYELGCAFIPLRKAGKLPFHTKRQKYDLEYGTAEIEIHSDACKPGSRVLIHDDLLATGGTASAAGKLIRDLGGEVAGFSFLINLSFLPGERILSEEFGHSPDFLIKY